MVESFHFLVSALGWISWGREEKINQHLTTNHPLPVLVMAHLMSLDTLIKPEHKFSLAKWEENTSKICARLRQGICDLQDHSKRLIMSLLNSYQYYSLFIIHEQLKWVTETCISQQPGSKSGQYRQLKERITQNKYRVLLSPVNFPQLIVRGNARICKASYCIWIKELKQLLMNLSFVIDIQLYFCSPHSPTSWQWLWQFSCALHDKVLPSAGICPGISLDVVFILSVPVHVLCTIWDIVEHSYFSPPLLKTTLSWRHLSN